MKQYRKGMKTQENHSIFSVYIIEKRREGQGIVRKSLTLRYSGLEVPERLLVTLPRGLTELTGRGGAAWGGAWLGGPLAPPPPPPPPSAPRTTTRLAPTSVSTSPAARTHTHTRGSRLCEEETPDELHCFCFLCLQTKD